MRNVPVHTVYLEMKKTSDFKAPPIEGKAEMRKRTKVKPEEHLMLYEAVGKEHQWFDRALMPEEELKAILEDDLVELHTLHVDGKLAGYIELDRRTEGDVEISYLGLLPGYLGGGLGQFLLEKALELAWSSKPSRVWLHTCEWDHKGAIPLYLKAGFGIYDRKIVMQTLPDE